MVVDKLAHCWPLPVVADQQVVVKFDYLFAAIGFVADFAIAAIAIYDQSELPKLPRP